MEPHILIGVVLIAVGVVDALVMPAIITRRMSNPDAAGLVKLALLGGGVVFTGLGIAFILGVIGT